MLVDGNISQLTNRRSPIMISEHLLPKIKTKRKPMGALYRSMNTTAGSGAQPPFSALEASGGEL